MGSCSMRGDAPKGVHASKVVLIAGEGVTIWNPPCMELYASMRIIQIRGNIFVSCAKMELHRRGHGRGVSNGLTRKDLI